MDREFKSHLSSVLLYGGIHWLERKDYMKAISFLSSSLKHSLKHYPFPHLKFASFCKNALHEVCFVLVNEFQNPQNLSMVCNAIHLLNDQMPSNFHRVIFLCANLINYGMISSAIEFAKNFLQLIGKRKDPSKQTISLLKILYNSCICISLFMDKQGKDLFSVWSPKHISLLVNASDSLFRNISSDPDLLNLFIGFISLLDKDEDYLNDFVGLFLGNLNLSIPNNDVICLKYFSKYAVFYANSASANFSSSSRSAAAIWKCNEKLSAHYKPTLERKEGAQFSFYSLKNVIISLYEKPTNIDYFYSNPTGVLGFAEIVFLQDKYTEVIVILMLHLMNITKHFSVPLTEVENLQLISERIAASMWKLGHFDNLLIFSQVLDKRTKFWFASQLSTLDMINDEIIPFLFDLDLIEYLATICKCEKLRNHMIENSISFIECHQMEIKNRIFKCMAIKYFGF